MVSFELLVARRSAYGNCIGRQVPFTKFSSHNCLVQPQLEPRLKRQGSHPDHTYSNYRRFPVDEPFDVIRSRRTFLPSLHNFNSNVCPLFQRTHQLPRPRNPISYKASASYNCLFVKKIRPIFKGTPLPSSLTTLNVFTGPLRQSVSSKSCSQ